MVELLNIDCMKYMVELPDKAFDLAIVDPPYGIGDFTRSTSRGKMVNRRYSKATWNNDIPSEKYFSELERVSKHRIIWGANYYNCFESGAIVWDKFNNHKDMSRCEIASNSIKRTIDYVQIKFFGFTDKDKIHPCQKPIKLYLWLLEKYAKAGDKILDTHLGSGSSAIAAYELDFDFVGCEIDRGYYESAVKRFNEAKMQKSLF